MTKFEQDELFVDGSRKYVLAVEVHKDTVLISTKKRVVEVPHSDLPKKKYIQGERITVTAEGEFNMQYTGPSTATSTGRSGSNTLADITTSM